MQLTEHCPAANVPQTAPCAFTAHRRLQPAKAASYHRRHRRFAPIPLAQPPRLRPQTLKSYTESSSLIAECNVFCQLPHGGATASTGLLAAERHAGVWTPVIAHKTISAEPQFALAA